MRTAFFLRSCAKFLSCAKFVNFAQLFTSAETGFPGLRGLRAWPSAWQ